jgi:hypothetical protein
MVVFKYRNSNRRKFQILLLQFLLVLRVIILKHHTFLAAKTSEFWGTTKRLPYETVDSYYNRFHELLDELSDGDDPISTKSAMRHFIFTLGPEFETIQNNFRIGNLPSQWKTQDWPTLLVLCRDYFNSVKPQGITRRDQSGEHTVDRTAQQKKVKEWFMNPSKFRRDIEAEQRKHPGRSFYHLSKSHTTDDCSVKKDCDKQVADRRPNTSSSISNTGVSGHLRHMKDDIFEDAVSDDVADDILIDSSNDTNEDELLYFARVTSHYLHIVKATSPIPVVS